MERSCTVECRAEVCVRCECKEKLCFVRKYKHHMHHSEHRTHDFVGDVCVLVVQPKEEMHHQKKRSTTSVKEERTPVLHKNVMEENMKVSCCLCDCEMMYNQRLHLPL